MKLRCLHGFFIFEETKVGQISDFASYSGLSIVPRGTYFTFEFLKDSPRYSIKGQPFLNLTATVNFEGEPWDVFAANGFVYDFTQGLLRPIDGVTQLIKLSLSGNKYVSKGLILPGSLTDEGERVKDYAAHFSTDNMRFVYSEVSFV